MSDYVSVRIAVGVDPKGVAVAFVMGDEKQTPYQVLAESGMLDGLAEGERISVVRASVPRPVVSEVEGAVADAAPVDVDKLARQIKHVCETSVSHIDRDGAIKRLLQTTLRPV